MINRLFVSSNWVSDGCFAGACSSPIQIKLPELPKMVDTLRQSQLTNIALGPKVDYRDMEVYEFEGIPSLRIRCQRMYINLITGGYPELYKFAYAPAPNKVVCIFDEDGLIGFVAIVKNEDEE